MSCNSIPQKTLSAQLRAYDDCFAEFLQSSINGQKHLQSILLRESFERFQQQAIGIQPTSPTTVLDVSCGPGEYSMAWTSVVSKFIPAGMDFHCTDFPGGRCASSGEKYTAATTRKIKEAACKGLVTLASDPVPVEANLFSGTESIITEGTTAHIVHWSHSGYHVRDALGSQKDNQQAIEKGLTTAINKMWAALAENGLMFSIHQTGDLSDGLPSEMSPISNKYLGFLYDIPQRIARRIQELGGYTHSLNFTTPLIFPELSATDWEAIKCLDPKKWESLNARQASTLRLLNFVLYDFSNSNQCGLEKLSEQGKLSAFIDEYSALVKANGGYINVKCAFQMICKSKAFAPGLNTIANQLRAKMPAYLQEMRSEMQKASDSIMTFGFEEPTGEI